MDIEYFAEQWKNKSLKFNGWVVLTYGILVLLGGVIDYLTGGSRAFLLLDSIGGAFLVGGGLGLLKNSQVALLVSLVTSGLLFVFLALLWLYVHRTLLLEMLWGLSLLVFLLLFTTKMIGKVSKE